MSVTNITDILQKEAEATESLCGKSTKAKGRPQDFLMLSQRTSDPPLKVCVLELYSSSRCSNHLPLGASATLQISHIKKKLPGKYAKDCQDMLRDPSALKNRQQQGLTMASGTTWHLFKADLDHAWQNRQVCLE